MIDGKKTLMVVFILVGSLVLSIDTPAQTSPPRVGKPQLKFDERLILSGRVAAIPRADLIVVQVEGEGKPRKIRLGLWGLLAPESGSPPAKKSRAAMKRWLLGKQVRVTIVGFDNRKLSLAIVRLGGRDINRRLVRRGLAWASRAPEYRKDERRARRKRVGLWRGRSALVRPRPKKYDGPYSRRKKPRILRLEFPRKFTFDPAALNPLTVRIIGRFPNPNAKRRLRIRVRDARGRRVKITLFPRRPTIRFVAATAEPLQLLFPATIKAGSYRLCAKIVGVGGNRCVRFELGIFERARFFACKKLFDEARARTPGFTCKCRRGRIFTGDAVPYTPDPSLGPYNAAAGGPGVGPFRSPRKLGPTLLLPSFRRKATSLFKFEAHFELEVANAPPAPPFCEEYWRGFILGDHCRTGQKVNGSTFQMFPGAGTLELPIRTRKFLFGSLDDAHYEPLAEYTAFANQPISTALDAVYQGGVAGAGNVQAFDAPNIAHWTDNPGLFQNNFPITYFAHPLVGIGNRLSYHTVADVAVLSTVMASTGAPGDSCICNTALRVVDMPLTRIAPTLEWSLNAPTVIGFRDLNRCEIVR